MFVKYANKNLNYTHYYFFSQSGLWSLNATFNNISAISVLLVEETGVSGENYRHVPSH
jgi:hypothetical protein